MSEHTSGRRPDARAGRPGRIEIVVGDITAQPVDAIVNAANSSLLGGGGVDGAIHAAAGPGLLAECRAIGGCAAGDAVITGAHGLVAAHVIHTVGPVWRGGAAGEAETLASCHRRVVALAAGHGIRTLAIPAISTGAYGYPLAEAGRVAVSATRSAMRDAPSLDLVRFVLFTPGERESFTAGVADGSEPA